MTRMRAELVYSRMLLVFLLALTSTNAWSHNKAELANKKIEGMEIQSSINGDVSPWLVASGIQIVSNDSYYPSADLSIRKDVNNTTPWVDEDVTFTIVVSNDGPDAADYAFNDVVPVGFSNITHISNNGSLDGNTISWNDQWIGAGEHQTFTFVATVDAPTGVVDEYKNITQITYSNKPDPDSTPNDDDGYQSDDDEDYVIVVPKQNEADLSLHKSVNNHNPKIGEVVTFSITVNNNGPKGADFSVEDVVPNGFSHINHINNDGSLYDDTITWSNQWIDAGKTQTFIFYATVNAPDCKSTDQYKNIAQITYSNKPDPDSTPGNDDGDQSEDDEDFAVVVPDTNICDTADLSLTKEINNTTPDVGETVTFTITVNNAGPKGADYSIEDVVPNGFSQINHINNGGTLNGNIITWTNQWINAHETQTFIFYAKVNAPDCKAIDQYKNVAQIIYSNKPDPDSTPNNDDGDQSEDDEDYATVVPNTNICDNADLSLTKTVNNATPNVGETVTFTITVNNAGPNDATNVGISDEVPAGYSNIANISNGGAPTGNTINWSIATIASGGSASVTFTADVNASTNTANEYRNTAQVSASDQPDPDSTPGNDDGDQSEDDEDFAIVTPPGGGQVADLSLTKTVNNATPNVGETVTFTITVNNAGPNDATNVGISDEVPAGYSNIANISNGGAPTGNTINWSIATIASGGSASVTFTADVNASTNTANEYRNTAQVSASDQPDPDSTPGNDDGDQSEDDEDFAIVTPPGGGQVADLSLTKTVNNATPNVGETVTFTITVNNAGPNDATNVGISDEVPAGYSNIANISNGGAPTGNTINWSIATIASGGSASVTFTADVNASTNTANEYRNTAQVSASDQPDPDSTPGNDDGDQSEDDEDFAIVTPPGGGQVADLSLTKTVNNATPNVGETVTFTITVNNAGPNDATNVGISDEVPAGYSNIANISNGGAPTGNTINWSIATIASGGSASVTFTADVNASTNTANEYRNTAQVSASDQPDPDSTPGNDDGDQSEDDEDFAIVNPPGGGQVADLSLTKTVNNATPNVGETVTFTITVNNAGPNDATNVGISDEVPAGYSNIANISNGGAPTGNTINWSIATIASGGSASVTFTADVNASTNTANEYRNTAQVSASDQPDPDSTPGNDDGDQSEDDEDFAIVNPPGGGQVADLSLTKTVNNATPNVGETVTFTITVNNAGPNDATNVGISDEVPAGYSNIANISNGGAPTGNTINWSIATIASGGSASVTFTADVNASTNTANEYRNTAQVSASDQPDPDSTPGNDDGDQSEDDEDFAIVNPPGGGQVADLSLTKTVNNATPNVGETVTFTITVNNAGPNDATNVGISDEVPAGYSNIANISNGGAPTGNTINWSIATIASGGSASVTFTADVNASTNTANEYRNTAQVSASDQPDPDSTPGNDDGDQSEDDEDFAIVNPLVDPTGRFYCEDDGRILTGGSVNFIPGPPAVVINANGSNGEYSVDFAPVVANTAYQMVINVPPGTLLSPTRPAELVALVTGAAAINLGSTDANNDGILDNFTAGANVPWYDNFTVSPGDQIVTNNNIPVTNCASNIITLIKVAGQATATVGSLVQYEIRSRTTQALPLTDIDIEDNIPGGFSYVDGSAIIIRAGNDNVLETNDDVVTNATVTGSDPIIFEDIDFAANEELIIRYFLQVGAGVVEGQYANSATCNNGFNIALCNVSTASVNVTQDPILEKTTIIGKVYADRDGDGWQDNANATNIIVKAQDDGGAVQQIESITGRVDQTDPLDDHQVSLSVALPADKNTPIQVSTDEGTILLIDHSGQVTEHHVGKKAKGLTAQELRLSTKISGNTLDLTISNHGFHEAGIPGVRIASVEGLLVETDEYGRYHLADINGGRWERGRNFILKVDSSTLPEGSEFTTENPRVLRITQGLMSKINFGVKLPKQDPVYKSVMQDKQLVTQEKVIETRELTGIVDPVRFDSGKADIPDSYIQQLQRAIDSLSDKDNVRISVIGHTDAQPLGPSTQKKFTDNYGLAVARADQVAKQLSEELNIDRTSIETHGRGPDEPVATNETLVGMAQNRRVEINVLFDETVTKSVTRTTYERVAIGRSDITLPRGGRIWAVEDPTKMDPRLDVLFHSAITMDENGTASSVTFNNYSNYLAFIQRWEVTLYNDTDVDLITPLATVSGDRSNFLDIHTLKLDQGKLLDESLWYVLRVYDEENRIDETVPKRIAVTDSDLDLFEPLTGEQRKQIANSLIGKNSLNHQRIPIHGSRVRINGSGIGSGYVLRIDGLSVPVSHKGTFVTEQHLPAGQHAFKVNVNDAEGQNVDQTIDRELNVDVTGKHFFMVGLANITVGENDLSGSVEALGEDDHFDEDVWVDGRLAFYLKGKVKGKYLITAQLDTTEDELRNLGDRLESEDPTSIFRKLDPDQYYAVYGDDSATIDDTDSQGMFYLRVDWDKSMALWGNYNTDITGTEFAQYNRSLYGAKLEHRNVNTTAFGDHRHEVHAFASEAQNAAAHNEFIATGGSLYYLRNTEVVQGSEKVWVEVRNRDTEQVSENITLKHGQDYDIDYLQGRIILTRPLTQVDIGNGPGIIRDEPLEGDDVFLLVDYEYSPDNFDPDNITAGIRGKAWLNKHIGIGGTYINEDRDGEDYELKGADVTIKAGKGTYFKFEYAESDAIQANQNLISNNGGITFDTQSTATTANLDSKAKAFGIEARANFAEMTNNKHQGFLMAWWKDRDAGFSSTARIDDGFETSDIGLEGEYQATRNLKLSTRITNLDKDELNERTTASVQGDYTLTDRLTVGAELRYEDEDDDTPAIGTAARNDSTATLAGLGLRYKINRQTELYTTGQLVLRESGDYQDNAGFTLGASRQINSRLALKGEVFHGDRGDAFVLGGEYAVTPNSNISISAGFGSGAATQVGTNYTTANGLELYGSYAVDPDRTDSGANAFTFGTKRKYQNGLQIYSESQFGEGDDEQSVGRTYGLDYDFTKEWRLSASLQTNDVEIGSGDIDRRAATLGARFKNDRVRFGTVLEYREDDDQSTNLDNTQWVTSNTVEWQKSESLRLLGKLDLSLTQSDQNKNDEAKYAELDLGFAYRPAFNDRLNVLGKYTFLYDLGTSGQEDARPDERAHIFSLEGLYDVNQRWELGAKYAHREGDVRLARGSGEWFESGAHLAVIRTRYHFIKKWDALIEYRWLEAETEDNDKHGFLVGAYRHIGNNFKVGAGYNFTDFDDDLTDQGYESDGWFFDVVGKY